MSSLEGHAGMAMYAQKTREDGREGKKMKRQYFGTRFVRAAPWVRPDHSGFRSQGWVTR